jgi:hypothetical protein
MVDDDAEIHDYLPWCNHFSFFFLHSKHDFFRFRLSPNTGDGRAAAATLLQKQTFVPRMLNPTFLLHVKARLRAKRFRCSAMLPAS